METAGSNLIESIMKILTRRADKTRTFKQENMPGWLRHDMGLHDDDNQKQHHARDRIKY
ncbi:hypothetical protein [Aeromonas dhakensis]|uniref:hypothetical protein n=1 Tax=Aeromonas dhakensis TaxID=196024 RepID=UPI003BA21EA8